MSVKKFEATRMLDFDGDQRAAPGDTQAQADFTFPAAHRRQARIATVPREQLGEALAITGQRGFRSRRPGSGWRSDDERRSGRFATRCRRSLVRCLADVCGSTGR